ncbi:MAG TPA: hypothetical protein VFE47_30245 [Tepidisphaeraceae bacterium]|nr:hypothetical protein [Tepidisphaeraceae bacterium]
MPWPLIGHILPRLSLKLFIDQASDIYALGAILYFLFSGRPPYQSPAGHSGGSSWQAILDQLSSGRPPDPLPVERKISRAAVAIVAKAMSRDPELRYASAAAMAEDLDACRTNRPTVAARPTTAGRLGLWYRRNPLVATLLIILLIVAVVGPSAYVRALRQEQRRTESHRQAEMRARQAAVAAQKVAVANERIAIEQRRRAEQQVAEGLVLQADAYSLANRWLTARATYRQAALALEKLGLSTFAADTGLWSAQCSSRPPLLEWQTPQWPSLAIAFSPDGHLLATGDGQKILRLWDPLTGRLLHERAGHEGAIMSVAFSPDGATLATGSADGTVRLWKTDGNDPPRLIQPTNHKYVQAVAFSPDGTLLASGGYDNTLHLWDSHTGQSKADIPLKHAVRCIRFFPGGNRIAVVSDAIQIIDVESAKVIRSLPSDGVVVAISADGSRLLAETVGKGLSIWNTDTWQVEQTLAGHDGAQISAASFIASSSTRAVTAGWDKSVRVWDLAKSKEVQNIAPHEGWVLAAALSPDGRRLVTSGYDRIAPMKLWDLDAKPPQLHGEARDLSPDGRCALVSGGDDKLHVVDLATGTDLRILPDSKNTSSLTVFRHGISQVYATSAQRTAREWEVSSGSLVSRPRDTGQWLARSPDGRYSLFDEKGGLVLHDDDANRQVWRKNFEQYVQSAAFSGDGRVIAAWSEDASPDILVIDAARGNKLNLFTSDTDYQTRDAALSRDGQLLLSTSATDIIEVRNTRTGESVRTFSTHGTPIGHVAIAPDATWIAGCGEDATIWLWDTASGREIRSFRVGGSQRALRIATDGKHLLVSGEVSIDCDFSLAAQERALSPRMQAARATLDQHPGDPAALAAIGQWYAFRYSDDLAIELLERARAGGAKVSPLEMARVYRRLGRNTDAAREYRNAKLQNEAPADYLDLCITASEGN